ncbi:uncharacterized protein LOC128559419 isoform X2 [Mercenaria mercenaria]|uniref:uncharacterized protein LOC128559419 isoform X2 n=1 Tax=Mercenaria mercenaria TaxID=6596 RepID=UPI00234EC5EF|nr:uncharacterized protein LOC128559419 isoform X2 [Mercenaria mercenaria]
MCSDILQLKHQSSTIFQNYTYSTKDMSSKSSGHNTENRSAKGFTSSSKTSYRDVCKSEEHKSHKTCAYTEGNVDRSNLLQQEVEAKYLSDEAEDFLSNDAIRKQVSLVKYYSWIKDEMEQTTAKAIANCLFSHDPQLLSHHDHECIMASPGRRNTVEQLLKRVLIGTEELHDAFTHFLRKEDGHKAKKLDEEPATDIEIKVFQRLDKSSRKICDRPDSDMPRLKFSKNDREILLSNLNRNHFIDPMNDQLLSKMIFSIREHTDIANCSMDSESKVQKLVETIELCSKEVFEDVCKCLTSLQMAHLVKKLEMGKDITSKQTPKRKYALLKDDLKSEDGPVLTSNLEQLDESSMVKRIRKDELHIKEAIQNHIDFTLDDLTDGSIVFQISPRSSDSWNILEQKCRSGEVKDFLPEVFRNEVENIGEGEHIYKLTIYILPKPPDFVNNKAIIELANPSQISKELRDLLCEELEITEELLDLLKSRRLVCKTIKTDLYRYERRKDRITYLLEMLEKNGKTGYEVLKGYIKDRNGYLYDKMTTEEGIKTIDKKVEAAGVRKSFSSSLDRNVMKEVFFTADVVLSIKKKDRKSKLTERRSSPALQMTCPNLINPCCYFDEGTESIPTPEDETKTLEDVWQFGAKVIHKTPAPKEDQTKRSYKSTKTEIEDIAVVRSSKRSNSKKLRKETNI